MRTIANPYSSKTITIIRGTTPTISYTFSKIAPTDVTSAALTLKQNGRKIIERDLTTADVTEAAISWMLSQKETLSLQESLDGAIYLDYLLLSGVRGAGVTTEFHVENSGKNEVML